jgi:WhiB family redox-sensing transcriptional regulator
MTDTTNDGVSLWQQRALCVNQPSSIFFVDENKDNRPSSKTEYKRFCDSCPVEQECLEYGIVYNMSGVWGGTTDKERHKFTAVSVSMLRDDYIESGLFNPVLKV